MAISAAIPATAPVPIPPSVHFVHQFYWLVIGIACLCDLVLSIVWPSPMPPAPVICLLAAGNNALLDGKRSGRTALLIFTPLTALLTSGLPLANEAKTVVFFVSILLALIMVSSLYFGPVRKWLAPQTERDCTITTQSARSEQYLLALVGVEVFTTFWRLATADSKEMFLPYAVLSLLVLLTVAAYAYHKHRQITWTINLGRTSSNDRRAPVVYLRAFEDDAKLGGTELDPITWVLGSEEEYLVEALMEIGPVVACARPGESLPPIGALRYKLSMHAWHDGIKALISTATIIFFRLPRTITPGILWEAKQIGFQLGKVDIVLAVICARDAIQILEVIVEATPPHIVLMVSEALKARARTGRIGCFVVASCNGDWRVVRVSDTGRPSLPGFQTAVQEVKTFLER